MDNEFIQYLMGNNVDPNLQLPDPSLLQYYHDFANRTLWVEGEVNENMLDIISKIIYWNREDKNLNVPVEQRKPIYIYFMSGGGSLDVQEAISSAIKISKTPIYGVAIGMVASAASLIYLNCHKRYAFPTAYFVLHKGSCEVGGANFNEIMAAMEDYRLQVDKMIKFYIENTLYTEEEVLENIETDWYIRGDELLEKGIITDWIEDIDEIL